VAARDLSWGDVRLVELDKLRPALVLTRSVIIPRLSTVTVAPITSSVRDIPTEVRLGVAHGLKGESAAVFDRVVTVAKSRVGRWLGCIGEERKADVRQALLFAFELDDDSLQGSNAGT